MRKKTELTATTLSLILFCYIPPSIDLNRIQAFIYIMLYYFIIREGIKLIRRVVVRCSKQKRKHEEPQIFNLREEEAA